MAEEPSRRRRVEVFGAVTGPEEVDALRPSVLGGWMGAGLRVREFEERFAGRLGRPFLMTNSGSSALHLAMAALELPPGSDVVVPSLTWVACAHSVIMAGHRPVFCDVDLSSANVTAEHVEAVRTPRTAAVMVVHYAGKPVAMDEIEALGLPVVEDAAHAVDSTWRGRPCGTLGVVGIFSFDAVKNVATPDGGGLTTSDDGLLDRAQALRYCGLRNPGRSRAAEGTRWWEDEISGVFPRVTPNDVAASIGLSQLDRLATGQERRARIWARYAEAFADTVGLDLPPGPEGDERHSWFTFLVRVRNGRRDDLARSLLAAGIYTTLRYRPLHLSPAFGHTGPLPNCETISEEGLNLPLHAGLSDEDVERVIAHVVAFA